MKELTYPQWSAERKLIAIAYRFYQGAPWGQDQGREGPAVGDYYCITRAGLALYQVSRIADDRVFFRLIYMDDGTRGDGHEDSFPFDEFTAGGFAPYRCYCPPWCFA